VPLQQILDKFKSDVAQCESLIANAHTLDAAGNPILPELDRQQITVAAFLNMFIAWEEYLEESIAEYLTGAPSINGAHPVKYATPQNKEAAKAMAIGMMKYFDYANHFNVQKFVRLYFDNGKPIEPNISAIFLELTDLRTIRNSCAHISSTTRTALESLALRVLKQPQPGISVYALLTATHPDANPDTVFAAYKNKLVAAADLIATG
jgi:hypothetical protein